METKMEKMEKLYHAHAPPPNQCTSKITQIINAPLPIVWSIVRQFDNPQVYKQFVKSCNLTSDRSGGGTAGSLRELTVVSGLPARRSTEKLNRLDDDVHVMVYSIIGGDHKLVNYQSTTTLHEDDDDRRHRAESGGARSSTVVMESYVVDIPADSCVEDTCLFVDTIIACNLKTLAKIAEKMACDEQVAQSV